uniref:ELM2 domain-containing protein n=1 Tax=Steinernema glaseri TaxID=37863 RepID=A0A1I7YXB4_9BILA
MSRRSTKQVAKEKVISESTSPLDSHAPSSSIEAAQGYEPQIGDGFQADIPEFLELSPEEKKLLLEACPDRDETIWVPEENHQKADELRRKVQTEEDLTFFKEELLLSSLYAADYDVDRAIDIFRGKTDAKSAEKKPFSRKEWVAFKKGLTKYGENFFLIQRRRLPQRTVGELVEIYCDLKQCDYAERDYQGRIGNEFQVDIPEYDEVSPVNKGDRAKTIWVPEEDENKVDELRKRTQSEDDLPFSNEERLLSSLYASDYDVDKAISLFRAGTQTNAAHRTRSQPEKPFSCEEWLAFKKGFKTYGKNFFEIQRRWLPQRTVGDLVEVYCDLKQCEYRHPTPGAHRIKLKRRFWLDY